MNKSTHFIGQPVLWQILSFINRSTVIDIIRNYGGERYVKYFNSWEHLVSMLYCCNNATTIFYFVLLISKETKLLP